MAYVRISNHNDTVTRSPEVEREILDRLATGETLMSICKDSHLPHRLTVLRWKRGEPEFRKLYEQARLDGMDAMADDLLEIADNARNDWMERKDPKNPGYEFNGEAVARARLRIDSRKFLMAKIAPHVFGDRVALTGADGGPIKTEEVSEPRILAQKIAFFLASHLPTDQSSDTETNSEVGA